jgi:ABC-type Zn uptake system ZnuABC Zn-binding protein ZnuA
MKREGVRLVIREVAYERSLADTLAERTGAQVVTISPLTGGLDGADTYVGFVEANLKALVEAVQRSASAPPAG